MYIHVSFLVVVFQFSAYITFVLRTTLFILKYFAAVMSEVMTDLFIFILIHVGDMEEEK
jgi:hypothetical protein